VELVWWQKAGIGALGGICLGLLKLIEARFYLDGSPLIAAYAAYLTYFAYIVLGSLVAIFLTDHDLPLRKMQRSAFILGLLAPSILLAIATQPDKAANDAVKSLPIPKLSSIVITPAYAEGVDNNISTATPKAKVDMSTIQLSNYDPTFSDAVLAALGRKKLPEKFAYVVGSTKDKSKAIDTANKLKAFLVPASTSTGLKPHVINVYGTSDYFVVLGDIGDRDHALRLKQDASLQAIKLLSGNGEDSTKANRVEWKGLSDLVVNAAVVPTRALTLDLGDDKK
jgi:hypothetical protein